MRKLTLSLALLAALPTAGCVGSSQSRRVETPVNVTHEVAFGDYRRVFNTAYHIVNRYGVVQTSSYRYGKITALISEDTSLWDKTRKTIQASIVDTGDYWDVQCRVLIAVETSDVATLQEFQPNYDYKTIASDPQLEVRLNNEIRAALSGGAWQAKEPLTPKARVPATPPARPKKKASKASSDEGEVSDSTTPRVARADDTPGAEAFERLGIARMKHGKFASAARAFQASLQAEGGSPFAQFLLAQAMFSQGEFDEALAALETGNRANGEWAKADFDVRELYPSQSGTFAQRLGELEDAVRADTRLGLLCGYMQYFSGDAQGALASFDGYLAEYADHEHATSYRRLARQKVDRAHGLEDF